MQVKNNFYTRIKCTGLNLVSLLNQCANKNIELHNLHKLDTKTIEFDVIDKDFCEFKKLNLKNFDISTSSVGGLKRLKKIICLRIGLIIGFFLSLILFFLIQNRIFYINIDGLRNVEKCKVIDKIYEYGVKKYSKNKININDLENYLSEEFEFSFVSIKMKGNALIVNVKEELPSINSNYISIIADYNMIIKSINVYSGTSSLKVGDIVYKGDTLVEPYENINGENIAVKPCAEISGDIFFSSRYEFFVHEEKMVRTKKSKILSANIYLGKIKILKNESNSTFENYDIENIVTPISIYFLPIKVEKIIAYEKVKVTIEHDFEEEKESIINMLKREVYAMVPNGVNIESEDIQTSSTKFGNITTIYLKSSVYLNYN